MALNSHGPRTWNWALEMANWLKGRGYEENQGKQLWNYHKLLQLMGATEPVESTYMYHIHHAVLSCPVVTLPIRVTCPSNEGVRLASPLMNSLVDTETSSTEEPPLAHSALHRSSLFFHWLPPLLCALVPF